MTSRFRHCMFRSRARGPLRLKPRGQPAQRPCTSGLAARASCSWRRSLPGGASGCASGCASVGCAMEMSCMEISRWMDVTCTAMASTDARAHTMASTDARARARTHEHALPISHKYKRTFCKRFVCIYVIWEAGLAHAWRMQVGAGMRPPRCPPHSEYR
jgi:hypothetical protein